MFLDLNVDQESRIKMMLKSLLKKSMIVSGEG